ncbi:hypothetical protein L3Q82_022330, partial [Scortum barcoo]
MSQRALSVPGVRHQGKPGWDSFSHYWCHNIEFCHHLGANVSLSSGYDPECNGQAECLNQELETCLRSAEKERKGGHGAMARKCSKAWAVARRVLLRGQAHMKVAADRHHRPAPKYTPGQKVSQPKTYRSMFTPES